MLSQAAQAPGPAFNVYVPPTQDPKSENPKLTGQAPPQVGACPSCPHLMAMRQRSAPQIIILVSHRTDGFRPSICALVGSVHGIEMRTAFRYYTGVEDSQMAGMLMVQEAIGRVSREQAEFLKPRFHITGATGWINDPNGMFQNKDGVYHVFYQVSRCDSEPRLCSMSCQVLLISLIS